MGQGQEEEEEEERGRRRWSSIDGAPKRMHIPLISILGPLPSASSLGLKECITDNGEHGGWWFIRSLFFFSFCLSFFLSSFVDRNGKTLYVCLANIRTFIFSLSTSVDCLTLKRSFFLLLCEVIRLNTQLTCKPTIGGNQK